MAPAPILLALLLAFSLAFAFSLSLIRRNRGARNLSAHRTPLRELIERNRIFSGGLIGTHHSAPCQKVVALFKSHGRILRVIAALLANQVHVPHEFKAELFAFKLCTMLGLNLMLDLAEVARIAIRPFATLTKTINSVGVVSDPAIFKLAAFRSYSALVEVCAVDLELLTGRNASELPSASQRASRVVQTSDLQSD